MIDEEEMIPVDAVIGEFQRHLESHPRTILSARYGDGKSYFLQKLIEHAPKDTVYLVIYPVNYQVASNKDIFQLVKFDILFQLYTKKIITDDYQIPSEYALSLFIQNNFLDVSAVLLQAVSDLGLDGAATTALLAGTSLLKSLKTWKDKFKSIQKTKRTIDIEAFMKQVVDNQPVYESDPITRIINDAIDKWKEEKDGRKIVLLFEDMDRIDPAHLFRIMNVLSAQMDYNNGLGIQSNEEIASTKFHVDNVVLVLDYINAKHIFRHFYGSANFEGYINKFTTRGYFTYSLKKLRVEYIRKMVASATGLPDYFLDTIIQKSFYQDHTLRELTSSINEIDAQILPITDIEGIKAPLQMLRLLVVLRRLGYSDDAISTMLNKVGTKELSESEDYYKYCGFYYALQHKFKTSKFQISLSDMGENSLIGMTIDKDKGLSTSGVLYGNKTSIQPDVSKLPNFMLTLINQ